MRWKDIKKWAKVYDSEIEGEEKHPRNDISAERDHITIDIGQEMLRETGRAKEVKRNNNSNKVFYNRNNFDSKFEARNNDDSNHNYDGSKFSQHNKYRQTNYNGWKRNGDSGDWYSQNSPANTGVSFKRSPMAKWSCQWLMSSNIYEKASSRCLF